MLESLFNKYAGLKACNFIKKRLQHRCFPNICEIFKNTYFYRTHPVAASGNISLLSLYWIWERWMVSFRGTYWLSSTYFILLRVFRFFLFLSFFFLIFLWILLLFSLKDTHREIAPSNKSPALRKSTIMNVWAVGTLNRIFIRGS